MEYSIYEVTRDEYKGFVGQIKSSAREVVTEQISDTHTATKINSKKTGKCLCSRVYYTAEYGEPDKEKYYIFEMPDDDERQPPTPVLKLKLKTKEEVQALFDAFAQLQKHD